MKIMVEIKIDVERRGSDLQVDSSDADTFAHFLDQLNAKYKRVQEGMVTVFTLSSPEAARAVTEIWFHD